GPCGRPGPACCPISIGAAGGWAASSSMSIRCPRCEGRRRPGRRAPEVETSPRELEAGLPIGGEDLADDRRDRVAALAQARDELRGLIRRQRYEQAARGLRVDHPPPLFPG